MNDKVIIEQLKKENRLLCQQIEQIMNTRAMRINQILEAQPKLAKIVERIYDTAVNLWPRDLGNKTEDIADVDFIIKDPSNKIVTICHPHWQGVRSAAEGQSPNVLLLPEASPSLVEKAISSIASFSPSYVILNGYWRGYDNFAIEAKKKISNVKIFYVHHGSFYQMLEDRRMPDIIALIIDLYQKGIIAKIGFVKHGMPAIFDSFGIEAELLLNRVPMNGVKKERSWISPIKIFIPATDHLRKNLHTQIMAALMIDDIAELHIVGPANLSYLEKSKAQLERIIVHSKLSRNEVFDLIQESTIVLYVTISECAPMIPLECFTQGVPCLTGANHGLFVDDPYLEDMLTVKKEDDPTAIVDSICKIKRNYREIQEAVFEFIGQYDKKAEKSVSDFLTQ